MLTIKLEESDCFYAWVMGGNTFLDTAAHDIKGAGHVVVHDSSLIMQLFFSSSCFPFHATPTFNVSCFPMLFCSCSEPGSTHVEGSV